MDLLCSLAAAQREISTGLLCAPAEVRVFCFSMMVWADLEVFSFRAISAVVLAVGWFGFFVAAVSRGCGSVAPAATLTVSCLHSGCDGATSGWWFSFFVGSGWLGDNIVLSFEAVVVWWLLEFEMERWWMEV
jgi:hypothetical protein